MSAQGGSGLRLPTNEQTRSVILSYLIHHGHKDTARAFMTEVTRRESTESIEKCPLWLNNQQNSNSDDGMEIVRNVANSALDHLSAGTCKQTTLGTTTSNTTELTKLPIRDNFGNLLEDTGIRRTIRGAIVSGKISDAIELITHHLPDFLPITTSSNSVPSPTPHTHSRSHEPSQTGMTLSSSAPVATPSSRAITPVESMSQALQPTEKAAQKPDAPATQVLRTGSPTQTDSQETPTPDRTSQRNPNSSLGRSVNPAHILLNLRVQEFLEAVRTVPLEHDTRETPHYPIAQATNESEVDVDMGPPEPSKDEEITKSLPKPFTIGDGAASGMMNSVARQRHLFDLASQLYQSAQNLQCPRYRDIYAKEVEQVCSLMIGPSPENSLAAPYLSMARREALADQVNSSMLHYVGESPAPALQIWAQAAKVVWDQINQSQLPLPRSADIPADAKMYARYVVRGVEGEDERSQTVMAMPFDFVALAGA
ncbi:hypothetical protein RhiJN_27989 [Ceratobasidium sp. AG-Ba]|nr:hypothetical protein RhiJN_27989 [Ceratobasidium sp. AG-Ba]